MSLSARRELARAVACRYHKAGRPQKSRMLDEFVAATGYNRKYAICVLDKAAPEPAIARALPQALRRRRRKSKYGPEIEKPFLFLWRVSGGLCPQRLVPFLPELIEALERFEEIELCPGVKDKLGQISVSTAGRLLRQARRQHERGLTSTLPGTLLRQQIPIRTYEEWNQARPGFLEVDLVAHCGATAAGDYLYTLTLTDIATGWTECLAILNRSQIAVVSAIEEARVRLPFPLLGIDSDNGSEFINHHLKSYCEARKITFTRCRPYRKNDQCHVEQKNGAVVRPLIGYARYETAEAADYLNRLYAAHRLSLNFFQPSLKLIGKSRTGAHVKKRYDQAKTPWARLQEAEVLSSSRSQQLKRLFLSLNPAKLRRDLEELEAGLHRFVVGEPAVRNVTIQKEP